MPASAISDSWFIDEFSETEMSDIWHIFRHVAVGHLVPETLLPRVGCTIKSVTDIRVAYQSEEVLRWSFDVNEND